MHANRDVSLTVGRGTIHGIIGENGAGKSTLMSILYGFYQADSGEVLINGERRRITSPDDAIAAGIGMVHQHFMLVDTFSVLENVMLGMEGGATLRAGIAKVREELHHLESEYGLDVDPDAPDRGPAGRAAAAGRDPEGALPRRGHADPGRADRRADAAGGGPALPHPRHPAANRARR